MEQSERGNRQPEEVFAAELAAFANDLTVLRVECGNPSLRSIADRAPRDTSLSPASISEILSGKRLPSMDTLSALVRALFAADGQQQQHPAQHSDPRLDQWLKRWRH